MSNESTVLVLCGASIGYICQVEHLFKQDVLENRGWDFGIRNVTIPYDCL